MLRWSKAGGSCKVRAPTRRRMGVELRRGRGMGEGGVEDIGGMKLNGNARTCLLHWLEGDSVSEA